jgi:cytochrome P450
MTAAPDGPSSTAPTGPATQAPAEPPPAAPTRPAAAAPTEPAGVDAVRGERDALEGRARSSPAGPVDASSTVRMPPTVGGSNARQVLAFLRDPLAFHLGAARRSGDVWQLKLTLGESQIVMTSHPDHAKSLFTAKAADAPSLTGASPLRPVLGPNSVLTLTGDQHMRQRKLLLPAFHGEAIERYVQMIREIAEREIDSWPLGRPFALAPRMQAVTLRVIMGGIFGVEGRPERGSSEYRLQETVRRVLRVSTHPLWMLVEAGNAGREDARGPLRAVNWLIDRPLYATIAKRRAAGPEPDRRDVLSLLLAATDEDGRRLTDEELRDELATLVFAGHETTANQLAWTFERLLRAPAAYERLREAVRSAGDEAAAYIEATIDEGMRARPVIPFVAREVTRPWQLGEYVLPAGTAVAINIVALHHRDDVYPDPHTFRPERFLDRKPGTYTWIPFGGGIRRCLGAELAMAEQRIVLGEIARRTDLRAPERSPEIGRQRNVTMIPHRGGRVMVKAKRSA